MDTNKRFLDIVRCACLRPGLYTITGETKELIALIHGLEIGLFGAESPLSQINRWLGNNYALPLPAGWLWTTTLHRCIETAQDAPHRIFDLLERYFLEVHQFKFVPPVIPYQCGYGGCAHSSDEETTEG